MSRNFYKSLQPLAARKISLSLQKRGFFRLDRFFATNILVETKLNFNVKEK